ncbi:MAG: glycosyltransferase, partial [Candidatus Omnitrophica bacterium]|nr:glycosyltransferase [Candidatus Omnitrophota bacterium]
MRIPFFSVIIPTYNRCKFLKIAIETVLLQTFNDYELIVVDDGSSDETSELIKKIKSNIIYIYQKHRGVSSARNKGIKASKGKYICFLDSDDRFRILKLELTYHYIKNFPRYKIFHTEELWYRNGSILPPKVYHKKPEGWVFKEALKLCCISISTVAIKREVFNEVGFFDENLPACEDYDFWLRATLKYPVKLIPHTLTIKEGGHPDQQSKRFPLMDKFRIYAIKKL